MSSTKVTEGTFTRTEQQQASVPQDVQAVAAAASAVVQNRLEASAKHPSARLSSLISHKKHTDEEIIGEIRSFLAKGGDPKEVVVGKFKRPTLLSAVQLCRFTLAEALVKEFGCDPTVEGLSGSPVFLILRAVQIEDTYIHPDYPYKLVEKPKTPRSDAILRMIKVGAPLVDKQGETILHWIAALKQLTSPSLLQNKEVRALANQRNKAGYTPLQHAVRMLAYDPNDADWVGAHLSWIIRDFIVLVGCDPDLLGPKEETLMEMVRERANSAYPALGRRSVEDLVHNLILRCKDERGMKAAEEQKSPETK